MNMLIGVLCEVISAVAAEEREAMLTSTVIEKMGNILNTLDSDDSGKISLKEFQEILNIPEALAALEQVGVDPVGIVDFAEVFFFQDGKQVDIEFGRFMEMVLDLRGSNVATVKDLMTNTKKVSGKFLSQQLQINELKETTKRIDRKSERIERLLKELTHELHSD
eukprot:gnl/TRDRNA2_/TRDRNA2_157973_c6_seq1.p1 gnl/TRDRNA2_/TRDRNA2_157973_c6~~gnl/TRDRNA2_/TRDRNA2_157973_c6_seq1.p1  ORF type:complete len:165 (+),score=42.82 gnl/TRDRNA2_/TRDRNA2_157973_c6_seq1:2-496(+)